VVYDACADLAQDLSPPLQDALFANIVKIPLKVPRIRVAHFVVHLVAHFA